MAMMGPFKMLAKSRIINTNGLIIQLAISINGIMGIGNFKNIGYLAG